MESRCLYGVMIVRSCATSRCEPCQGLTAAALSNLGSVPQGCFAGATGKYADSVFYVGVDVYFFCKNIPAYLDGNFFNLFRICLDFNRRYGFFRRENQIHRYNRTQCRQ